MMPEPPSIAVIISTYNAPDFLRLALEAWMRQTDKRFRVYVADDGSDDATKALIQRAQDASPIPIEHVWHEDKGFRKARIHNIALSRAREPYVLLTDGDCLPPPDLVAIHRRLATPGCFMSGSRILLSRAFTERLIAGRSIVPVSRPGWIARRLRGDINRIMPLLLPPFSTSPHQRLEGIRGCHLACWREDLETINGFDESYEGWGREDSDLAARLFHAGVKRRDLRGAPVLHLWHREASRERLDDNDAMLRQCLAEKRVRARQGLQELQGQGANA